MFFKPYKYVIVQPDGWKTSLAQSECPLYYSLTRLFAIVLIVIIMHFHAAFSL